MKDKEENEEVRNRIKIIRKECIDKLLESLKTGKLENFNFMNCYTEVRNLADEREEEILILLYYGTIEDYIIQCKTKLIEESKTNLIDGFLLHTKNINFLIYWMVKVFSYLDFYYTRIGKKTLSEKAMDYYKSLFFKEFKDKIQEEFNNLKKEENKGSEESQSKIKSIMEILESLELEKPKITKEKGQIKWVDENKNK